MRIFRAFSWVSAVTIVACLAGTAIAETWELPPPLSESEVRAFSERFANADKNPNATESLSVDIEFAARAAGLEMRNENGVFQFIQPTGMTDKEFTQRRCNHERALGQIYSPKYTEESLQPGRKIIAVIEIFEPSALDRIPENVKCHLTISDPDGRYAANTLLWARELRKANPAELRRLETQHRELADGILENVPRSNYSKGITTIPQVEKALHWLLADVFDFLAKRKERELAKNAALADKAQKKVDRRPRPTAEMWLRALPGDVDAQMEIALGYESGGPDYESLHRAHYWYLRAWKNGAGTAALNGANRTHAKLTEAEKKLVDEMIATDQPPSF